MSTRFLFQFLIALGICIATRATAMDECCESLQPLPPVTAEVCFESGDMDNSLVVPVSYMQPLFRRSSVSSSALSQRFQLRPFNLSSMTRLGNNFTADPEFERGIVVLGEDVALKIGGYVKADLIKDFDAIESTDKFDTTTIDTTGPQHQNARFHARQSRLSFDTRWAVDGEVVRAFVESDFFGEGEDGSDVARLRHAYGTLGGFTAGQTWTTFTDPSAVPQTLDVEGAASNVNRRQGLVRWTRPLWGDSVTFAMALEDPRVTIETPPMLDAQARTELPDLISRLRWEPDWGEFQVACLVRELGLQPAGQPVITGTGWGFNFTGSCLFTMHTKAYYQITFGDGIGSYRGSPDVVSTGPLTAEILPVFGWMFGLKQEWTDRLTSNLTYSQMNLDNLPGQDPSNLASTDYLALNLIANPYERVFCGVEYLYGIREDVSGAIGIANRLQFAFGYFLP